MNFGNQNQEMHLYQNPRYNFERRKRQTLIVDVKDTIDSTPLSSATQFSLDLFEPLLIDKESEIYLDNFISFSSNISNIPNDSAFCLNINEFNIQTNVASSDSSDRGNIFNKLVIPNEHNSTTDLFSAIVHKGKKYNYVCDINPCKLGRITGKITNLAGLSIFAGGDTTHNHTYLLSGFTSTQIPHDIAQGDEISFTNGLGVQSQTNANVISSLTTINPQPTFTALIHSTIGATSIIFSSNTDNIVLNENFTLSLILSSGTTIPINLTEGDTIAQNTATGIIQESKTVDSNSNAVVVQVKVTAGAFTATALNSPHTGITIQPAPTAPTLSATVGSNTVINIPAPIADANLSIIQGSKPRFVSEFTIISKE